MRRKILNGGTSLRGVRGASAFARAKLRSNASARGSAGNVGMRFTSGDGAVRLETRERTTAWPWWPKEAGVTWSASGEGTQKDVGWRATKSASTIATHWNATRSADRPVCGRIQCPARSIGPNV